MPGDEAGRQILLSQLWMLAHTSESKLVRDVCRKAARELEQNQPAPVVDRIDGVPNQRANPLA